MNILLFNCSWHNRGDEAANRAMIDQLSTLYPDIHFTIFTHRELQQFPFDESKVNVINTHCFTRKNLLDIPILLLTKGKKAIFGNIKTLISEIQKCDFVMHAPGGPSMGDLYKYMQFGSFFDFLTTKANNKPYMFYAPSMGPFNNKFYNILRKKIYNNAQFISTRENVSAQYAEKLNLKKDVIVTLDSAFQYPVDKEKYAKQFEKYTDLKEFYSCHTKIIGITITDLKWHAKYNQNNETANKISTIFKNTVKDLTSKGYGVLFIPQLFGEQNDFDLMSEFMTDNCFIVDHEHDCYFQQYIIEKLYFVIGLRYHSNIFSAKMCTPFISVSYEQKMSGFANIINMQDYCINIEDLTQEELNEKINLIENNYTDVKNHLISINSDLVKKSRKTTDLVVDFIENSLGQ